MNAVSIAIESAGTTLLKALLNEIAQLPKPWQQTPAREQEVIIDRLRNGVEVCVRAAVTRIAAGSFQRITAEVESVTFKDGVKAVVQLPKGDAGTHTLADKTGGQVLIVIANEAEYVEGMQDIEADEDQPDMFAEESAAPSSEALADTDRLLAKLAELGVRPGIEAAAWTERERAVAWEWALAYEADGEECKIARPHWLPIPEAVEQGEQQGEAA